MVGRLPLQRGVPQPHRRLGVDRAERQVLGHALGKPERWIDGDDGANPAAGAPARPDVVLELVRHFVLQHVLELRVGAGERQDRPVPLEVGDAAGAFAGGLAPARWSAGNRSARRRG